MDMESFETFDIEKPTEEEIVSKIKSGVEVEYWLIMGRRK